MPDWRDAAAYEPLLDADRSFFAWEWLRRNPDYRVAAKRALEGFRIAEETSGTAESWGLHAFEAPHLTAPDARPVWSADVCPHVLGVRAVPADGEDIFDLERCHAICTLVTAADGREHLLISDGLRAIRIDVEAGTLKVGPVRLEYSLAGFVSAERPLQTLRRLLALYHTGRFSAVLHPSEARARRFVLMLRVYDARVSGATQREIAIELLSGDPVPDRWRVKAPTVRSQVQRLVRGARAMAAGGYLILLSG
ncbi:MAG: DUF2285 domain-containing protein [Pseudomonadota bacterium]|nr:DUF2285 domain-containing protein [Pseudomonadota bacterium]